MDEHFAVVTGYIVRMNSAQLAFYVAIGVAGSAFIVGGVRAARRSTTLRWPTPIEILIGFVTDFFDTLGIGSFAPTTAIYKLRRMVPDELIPGTLNVGHAPSAVTRTRTELSPAAQAGNYCYGGTCVNVLALGAANSGVDPTVAKLRSRVTDTVRSTRRAIAGSAAHAQRQAREVLTAGDSYVREQPWEAVGAAVLVGVIVGLLVFRR